MNVFDLVATITIDTSEYESGLQRASFTTQSFADSAGAEMDATADGMESAFSSGADSISASADSISSSMESAADDVDSSAISIADSSASFADAVSSGADDASNAMGTMSDAMDETGNSGISTLFELADSTIGLGDAFGGAGSMAKDFGSKLLSALKTPLGAAVALGAAVTTLTTALVKGANKTAAYGDNVDKMSQKIGISAEKYQQWDYVMERAGSSVDNLKMGLKTLSSQAEKNSDAFQKLGISEEEVANLSKEDLFERTIAGLAAMEEGTERSALASQLLGRAGADLGPLLNQGTDAIEEQKQMAMDYGMVMSDEMVKASAAYTDAGTTLSGTIQGMKNDLLGELLPSMTQVKEGLAALFAGDGEGAIDFFAGLGGFILTAIEMIPQAIGNFAKGLGEAAVAIAQALGTALVENVPVLFEKLMETLDSALEKLSEWEPGEGADGAGLQIMQKIGEGIAKYAPIVLQAIGKVALQILKALGLLTGKLLLLGAQLMLNLMKGAIRGAGQLLAWLGGLVLQMVQALLKGLGKMLSAGVKLMQAVLQGLRQGIANIASIGTEIVHGIWKGISNGLGWIKKKIREWVGNVKSFLKRLFGISSPSKWARDEIGQNIVRGLAGGLERYSGLVDDAMGELMPDGGTFEIGADAPDIASEMETAYTMQGLPEVERNTAGTSYAFYITNNITGADDPEDFARRLCQQMRAEVRMAWQ